MISEAIPCCWQAIGLDKGVMAHPGARVHRSDNFFVRETTNQDVAKLVFAVAYAFGRAPLRAQVFAGGVA